MRSLSLPRFGSVWDRRVLSLLLAIPILASGAERGQGGESRMLYEFDFATDPVAAGWTLIPTAGKPGELTYVPSEGFYPDKGARWQSPTIPAVADRPWQFYALEFETRSSEKNNYAVFFQDATGAQIVADDYASFDPSDDFVADRVVTRGREGGRTFTVNFFARGTFHARNVRALAISREAAAEWADGLYARLPPLEYVPPAGRWARIPRTMERLRGGGALRVVMLGDSIVNDTKNSNFDALLARLYPGAELRVVASVRGGTGCWHYRHDEPFQTYVADARPDLLFIGGISQRGDLDAIREVIAKAKAGIGCEIILASGPMGVDWRAADPDDPGRALPLSTYAGSVEFETALSALADETGVEFIDMKAVWDDYLGRSGKPFHWFHRDGVHANNRGKQILARILERYFQPAR